MMSLNYFISINMFIMSCFMLFYFYNHLLLILISLEFLMISISLSLFLILIYTEVNLYLLVLFLVMGVCEGALGLSLIVLIIRLYGNDYLNSLSLLKW